MSARADGVTIRCPFCALPVDMPADAAELPPGAFLICFECEGLCCTTPDGDLRRPTELELKSVNWDRYNETVEHARKKKQGNAENEH